MATQLNPLDSLQFFGAINDMFRQVMLQNPTEQQVLQYAIMLQGWEAGITIEPNRYYRHGIDGDGEYIVYQSIRTTSYVSQENTAPDDEIQGNILFKKIGYVDRANNDGTTTSYRLWTQPYAKEDSYRLGELAPIRVEGLTVDTKAFEDIQGQTVYRDEYITYLVDGEKHLYKIGVNQVTVSSQYVTPETPDNPVYIPVTGDITYTDTTATIGGVEWYESTDPDNDNRWHPTTSAVWRKV